MRAAQGKRFFALGILCCRCMTVCAQDAVSAQISPQMQLMISQPPVDIASPVAVTASFDPPVVRIGEKSVYRITFTALEASLHLPSKIPAPAGLSLTPGAHGETMQFVGNIYRPLASLNFHIRSGVAGNYTVPSFQAEIYDKPVMVPEAHLTVVDDVEAAHEPARQLILEPSGTNIFVGETLSVRVLAPGTLDNVIEALAPLQFNGDGFFAGGGGVRQSVERLAVNGRMLATLVTEADVVPIAAGEQTLSAQAFTAGAQFSGPIVIHGQATIPGGARQTILLDSDPVTIHVRPLPGAALPGFTGFIGSLMADAVRIDTNSVRPGDPLKMFVTFHSDGSLSRFVPPPPPRVDGWEISPPIRSQIPSISDSSQTDRSATFAYTLVPLTDRARSTPAIPFCYFDPKKPAYVDMTLPAIPLTVAADGLAASAPAATEDDGTPAQNPSLSALAPSPGKTLRDLLPIEMQRWFIIAQLLPACALLTLWNWDCRRRFLEAHPQIAARFRALRALRREKRALRRAAADGDAAGFIRSGTMMLRLAAAPHYSAEPRAMVCGEILNLFTEAERAGRTGKVIRQFFSDEAAANFSPLRGQCESLFALLPEFEEILKKMEARL